jgi:hypothetical protein
MEVRLWVQADSRDDLALFPQTFDFGKIGRGATPTQQVIVSFPSQARVQVNEARCENKFIQVKLRELTGDKGSRIYRVSASVRADIPEGSLGTHVELSTNNPAMPRLRVPLSVEVEPAPR